MSLIPQKGEDKPRVMIPEGQHIGICCHVVDLGTQPGYKGKPTPKFKLAFEFPDHQHEWDEDEGAVPMIRAKRFTNSMHEKSAIVRVIKQWGVGKAYRNKHGVSLFEAVSRDGWAPLIGWPALVQIEHAEFAEDDGSKRVVDVIAAINQVPEAMMGMVQKPITPPVVYNIDEHPKNWDKLAERTQKEIRESQEFRDKAIKEDDAKKGNLPLQTKTQKPENAQDDDDIPF